jgi:hypothetical protein
VAAIPALLNQAREDLATAQRAVADANLRIGKPFKHAHALRDTEAEFRAVQAELADMQSAAKDPGQVPESARELTVEAVRSHQPAARHGTRPMPAPPIPPSHGRDVGGPALGL